MRNPDLLRISVEHVEEARLVRVAGEVDISTVGELRRQVRNACRRDGTVLLDLADVAFMDSSGLTVLLEASNGATTGESPFFIVRPSDAVRRLLDATGTRAELPVVEPHEHMLR
jgi:anti-sigma B factor antagonist